MKKAVYILIVVVMLFSITACQSQTVTKQDAAASVTKQEVLGELTDTDHVLVGESGNLTLMLVNDGIVIQNKQNGSVWSSFLSEEDYDISSLNKLWKAATSSLIGINYAQSRQSVQILSTNSGSSDTEITYYRLANGVKICYDFTKLKISLALYLWVEDNQLVCQIPNEDIKEYGTAILTSVEVMQFMGAANNTDNGYILYPDGSGALMEFQKIADKKLSAKQYEWQIYGSDSEYLREDTYAISENGSFYLPVFGVKRNTSGYVAMITKGSEDAAINLYTSDSALKMNRVCSEFIYRRTYDVTITSMKSGSTQVRSDFTNISEDKIESDREIRYFFMNGEGDYSEMADTCREYMLKTGMLTDHITDADTMPLGVDFFIGTNSDALIPEYLSMTSFQECEDILSELNSRGVKTMTTTLKGWTKNGYGVFPTADSVNDKAGGKSGLNRLLSTAASLNTQVYLNMNFVDIDKDTGGYSDKNDVIRSKSNTVITNDTGTKYLLTASTAQAWFTKNIKQISSAMAGISFEGFGKTLYNDYQKNKQTEREQTASAWANMMEQSNAAFGGSAAYGGNLYTLSQASRLYDIPYENSGFAVADCSVPFFQMVVHGSIAYSTTPANLFYDYDYQVLKLLEYGYMPYFELTYEPSNVLKDTEYNTLFTSYYESYVEKAAELYTMFDTGIGECWNAYMIRHEAVEPNVYKVTYDNGVIVYINYTDTEKMVDGISVPARGFETNQEENK